ncbi:MAG: hypothetical protein AAF039_10800 [Bacteroidota bacterium]
MLKTKLEGRFELSAGLWEEIAASAKQINLKKGEVLIPYCSLQKAAYPIISGSLKQSLIHSNGTKTATWFFFEHIFNVLVCFDSYSLNEYTKYEVTALEDTVVFEIKKDRVEDWAERFPSFSRFYRNDCIGSFFMFSEIRNHMVSHSALEFVQYLRKYYPNIINKVPSKYLAEFMGITPEWLSKLKKRRLLEATG